MAIKEMQKSLNDWGYTDWQGKRLSEDGDFGINTFNSVIKFQMDNDLVPDGIVGDKTWQAMSDRKKKEEGEIYTNPSNIDSGAVAPQSDVDSRENVNNPRKHGAFATIDKAFDTSPAKGKENTVTEDDLTEDEDDFESLKEKGSVLSVHSGSPYTIKELQKELNSMGYTDGRGEKLEEDGDFGINTFNSVIKFQMDNDLVPDGIVSDKTWQAISDKKKEKETFYDRNSKSIYEEALYNPFPKEVKFPYPTENEARFAEEEQAETTKESGVIKPGYNEKGEWSEDPDADNYGKDSLEYMMISKLDDMCESAEGQNKDSIASFAEDFRDFDADSICRAYYLNDSDGASNMGHTGILLVNEHGEGFLFSYGAATENFFYGDSRMNIGIYSPYEVLGILKGNEASVLSTEGFNTNEKYERWVYYDVSAEEGSNMFNTAINATVDLEKYALFWNNCDQVVNEIFKSGGEHVTSAIWPNLTYEKERIQNHVKEFGQDMKRYSERLLKKLRGIWE